MTNSNFLWLKNKASLVKIGKLRLMQLAFLFVWTTGFMVFWNVQAASGKELDFAVIQPGQPGNSDQAKPVMDALSLYVQKKLGHGISVKGRYFNKLEDALLFMEKTPPAWSIVRLGFYSDEARRFNMVPIASTLPKGSATDRWRLVTRKNGTDNWRSLKGKVFGNMLFEQKAAACILFDQPVHTLPFQLKGTNRPLRSLRKVAAGKAAGAVLDSAQYKAIKPMNIANKIKIIHTSRELPSDPVVWLGKPDKWMDRLSGILVGMKEDPDAVSLLRMLQTEGFGPVNKNLSLFIRGKADDTCFE